MSKTYKAIYADGRLEWVGEQPGAGRHYVLVTVLERAVPRHTSEEVHRVLEETRGAWGSGKTQDEIDTEIEHMRAEWDRIDTGPEGVCSSSTAIS